MVTKVSRVKQGDLRAKLGREPKRPPFGQRVPGCAGVRALIVAMRRPKGRGAKGRRKVESVLVELTGRQTRDSLRILRGKQAGDTRDNWSWVEPCVWTERMLAALESGVKGGKWFSLIDKVYSEANLRASFARVKANAGGAGVDHQTVERYEERLEENLASLRHSLMEGTYRPQAIRRVWIPKPGTRKKRPLGIPTVRDRVAQTALRHAIEPVFERDFAINSWGFRPGRGCKQALSRVYRLLKEGYTWVVDADLKSYFDTIPHGRLMALVEEKIGDGRVVALVEAYLKSHVMETVEGWTVEEGTPQGAVISPLLANIYLNPLDHLMQERGIEMVRYADDLVLLCQSAKDAEAALAVLREWVAEAGLMLHPEKTCVVDAAQEGGFDFLGYHFECGYVWPSSKSTRRLRDTLRAKTGRSEGRSLKAIVEDVSQTLRGWSEYFKHGQGDVHAKTDAWLRMRLRSILRKRQGRHGRGRGFDHVRYTNAFFAGQGLFSLAMARAEFRQSLRR